MSELVKYNLYCNHVETGEGYGGVLVANFSVVMPVTAMAEVKDIVKMHIMVF